MVAREIDRYAARCPVRTIHTYSSFTTCCVPTDIEVRRFTLERGWVVWIPAKSLFSSSGNLHSRASYSDTNTAPNTGTGGYTMHPPSCRISHRLPAKVKIVSWHSQPVQGARHVDESVHNTATEWKERAEHFAMELVWFFFFPVCCVPWKRRVRP